MISLKRSSLEQQTRIDTSLKNLRERVKKFAVVDSQGNIIGEVTDLMVDSERQLNFVVYSDTENKIYFNLNSSLVKKIDSRLKCVFIKIDLGKLHTNFENIKKESTIMSIEKDDIYHEINSKNIKNMEVINNNNNSVVSENVEVPEEEIIRLLGEKIIVDRSKRKVGEVIVRKEIETRIIQVPVRREKLIVEQVSPEHKQLAEIDLGEEEISRIGLIESEKVQPASLDSGMSVSGEFSSPKIASLLLNAIALERNHGCKTVRVTVTVENEEYQKKYQEWFAHTSTSQ
ncbi:YsnF/AvaK domain-containing protein [Aetokthonos hydrillicola Thurmond2011]|jgi:hypothetical protein|uniref:YsnF/AvaK domain-containing protein n=2 Tax=Aetokthonos TaxID=1550243 RepID=A0AAP5IBT6_9CYAN|nr:PRC-barrel domain-containing protein [Aetokthonos hydrillicola]MBO3457830.1 DUF2382 domain-containing protein [Aetokthonos hydrillicola CCALA 1050]MBW4588312.1 YsnF/AvaK domain-containing protein [Aetokthonos hydrillicola CCALA 1050]MDR9897207.1 YsnF/AvaK domain-containing protein [Aetokthonos hydrillicola Thurmond2011]